MQNNKKILVFILLIFVVLVSFNVRETLSKYVSRILSFSETQVAAWNVKVNGIQMGVEPVNFEASFVAASGENVVERQNCTWKSRKY